MFVILCLEFFFFFCVLKNYYDVTCIKVKTVFLFLDLVQLKHKGVQNQLEQPSPYRVLNQLSLGMYKLL
jgi:hypothetical protein